jgi:hypothetical protein
VKWRITHALNRHLDRHDTARELSWVHDHPLFPKETAIPLPNEILAKEADSLSSAEWNTLKHCLEGRMDEARINIIAEFLENCSSIDLPYQAVETLQRMNNLSYLPGPSTFIHHTHQIRLANSIHNVFSAGRPTDLLNAIINSWLWSLYAEGPTEAKVDEAFKYDGWESFCWLDHPCARQKIKEAFTNYENKLTLSAESPDTLSKLRNILRKPVPGTPSLSW